MVGALTALKPSRDVHAHTYLKGTTLKLDAPSITLARFDTVYAGLRDVEVVLEVGARAHTRRCRTLRYWRASHPPLTSDDRCHTLPVPYCVKCLIAGRFKLGVGLR